MSPKEMRAQADECESLAGSLEPTPSGWFRVTTTRRSMAPPREKQTMTRDQAKRAILEEWRLWAAETNIKNANGRDGLRFFRSLERECKHLLAFRASGDKWQVVHSWLLRAKLVSD